MKGETRSRRGGTKLEIRLGHAAAPARYLFSFSVVGRFALINSREGAPYLCRLVFEAVQDSYRQDCLCYWAN